MIVFDLKCAQAGHIFEAWFGHSDDYESQRAKLQIQCPICGNSEIGKALMAPNISAKSNVNSTRRGVAYTALVDASLPEGKALMAKLAKVQAQLVAKSTWVGRDFARKARAMDAGEAKIESIYGEASHAEARALIDDGIEISTLPLPVIPPDQCN